MRSDLISNNVHLGHDIKWNWFY